MPTHEQAASEARQTTEELRRGVSEMTRGRGGQQGEQLLQTMEGMPSTVYLGGVAGSILLSAILFALGRRDLAIFVGLWPPTILNLAVVSKTLRPSHEMK